MEKGTYGKRVSRAADRGRGVGPVGRVWYDISRPRTLRGQMMCLPTQRQKSQQPTQRQQRCLPGPLMPKLDKSLPGFPGHESGALGSLGSGQVSRHGLGELGSRVAWRLREWHFLWEGISDGGSREGSGRELGGSVLPTQSTGSRLLGSRMMYNRNETRELNDRESGYGGRPNFFVGAFFNARRVPHRNPQTGRVRQRISGEGLMGWKNTGKREGLMR